MVSTFHKLDFFHPPSSVIASCVWTMLVVMYSTLGVTLLVALGWTLIPNVCPDVLRNFVNLGYITFIDFFNTKRLNS